MVPRHKLKRHKPYADCPRKTWNGLKASELKGLDVKIKNTFSWKHSPRQYQLEAISAQLLRKDVLLHAGTGSGKTAVAAGPHAHEKAKGMVTFMISPLIALQEEQVQTFRDEFGLTAIAVNSAYSGCSPDVMKKICYGEWQIVVISPEMILSKRFISNVLRNSEMQTRVMSVVIDKAHVVSQWGASFRKTYGTLGILRLRVRRDVLKKLQFNLNDYTYINLGNDRPNVSIVVRPIHNPMNTYSDLAFLVPESVINASDIKHTMIYADSVSVAADMSDYLYSRGPESFRAEGIIRRYSAAYSSEYRDTAMALFRAGTIRILICTDAAGMGCNIPDIDVVVQWKLPATVSTFVQRAGRAGRGPGQTGIAVLLVEKSVYDLDLSHAVSQPKTRKNESKNSRQPKKYSKAGSKSYAIEHGVLRGAFGGASDSIDTTLSQVVELDKAAVDEGLYTFVQTTTCRRAILTEIYNNDLAVPTVPCCDICCPSLLDLTRPAAPTIQTRTSAVKTGVQNLTVLDLLVEWRKSIWERDFSDAMFGPSGFLKNDTMEMLASVGPIVSGEQLKRVVGESWPWLDSHGGELVDKMASSHIPAAVRKPVKPRQRQAVKRNADCIGGVVENQAGKRRVLAISADAATVPTPSLLTSSSSTTRTAYGQTSTLPPDSHIPDYTTYNPFTNFNSYSSGGYQLRPFPTSSSHSITHCIPHHQAILADSRGSEAVLVDPLVPSNHT